MKQERKRRRLEKKAKKVERRKADETVAGYQNESNPFGDQQLSQKFVWNKKIQKDEMNGKVGAAHPLKTHYRLGPAAAQLGGARSPAWAPDTR